MGRGERSGRPGALARAINAAIRGRMAEARPKLHNADVAAHMSHGSEYLRRALHDDFALTLNDLDEICIFIGVDPAELVRDALERAQQATKPPVRLMSLTEAVVDDVRRPAAARTAGPKDRKLDGA